MSGARKFRNPQLMRQPRERARLKVVTGPDAGSVFVIESDRVVIGRDDGNDVMIADLKASRKHAELIREAEGWVVKDLGSSNGVKVNGKQVSSSQLKPLDSISVGETVFQFVLAPKKGTLSSVVAIPSLPSIPPAQEQRSLEERREQIQRLANFGEGLKSILIPNARRALPGGSNRNLAIYAIMGVLAFFLFFVPSGDEKKPRSSKKADRSESENSPEQRRDLASMLPSGVSTEVQQTSQMFFKSGFREYRERNYLRAKRLFENAIQVAPSHEMARFYLTKSKQAIEDEASQLMERARKNEELGKIREARVQYESVVRILSWDPQNRTYVQAKQELDRLELQERRGG